MNKATLTIFTLFIISFAQAATTQLSSESFGSYNLRRLAVEKLQGFDTITKSHITRRLTSNQTGPWRRMKIYFDLTTLENENPSKKDFYRKVFKITGQWWEQAVWINDSVQGKNNVFAQGTAQGIIKKFNYPAGKGYKDYDLVVDVHMMKDDGGTLAAAGPLYRHEDSQRPITGDCGVAWFGDRNFEQSDDSVNKAVGTIVHEFAHVMAFISMKEYHPHYTKYDSTLKSFKWTGPRVKEFAAKYYGCDAKDMNGVLLQTTSPTEPGAHWSESLLNDELLTPVSGSESEKVSAMTMAFMEDTKWYKADYTKIENYDYKKSVPGHCAMKKTCNERTACKAGTSDFVTYDFRGIAYCEKDNTDGCYKEVKYGNRDVSKPAKWPKYVSKYGASFSANSIIVKGNFLRFVNDFTGITSTTVIPVQADCNSANTYYTMTFKDYAISATPGYKGDAKVICTKANEVKKFNCYEGYCSEVVCYDPKVLCPRRFAEIGGNGKNFKSCHTSCMKNGRCQPGLPFLQVPARRLAHERAEMAEITRHFPRNRRLVQSKVVKSQEQMRNQMQAMDETQLTNTINKFKKVCNKMSKDNTCGPNKGFCQEGWCHKTNHVCGVHKFYMKNKWAKYSSKSKCATLHYAKLLQNVQKKNEQVLKGWNIDNSGNGLFKDMMMSLDDLMDIKTDIGFKPLQVANKADNKKKSPSAKAAKKDKMMASDEAKPISLKKVGLKLAKKTNVAAKWLQPENRVVSGDYNRMNKQELLRLGAQSQQGKWKCWCYSDGKSRDICPDLLEDQK